MHRRSFLAALLAAPAALWVERASACSRVFVNDRGTAKIVARSMDLPVAFPERPKFFVFPRGLARDGRSGVLPGVEAQLQGLGANAVRWTGRYGLVGITGFDGAVTDGLNERGLAAHMLVLGESRHEPADGRPELADALWAQYVLENFATVGEVVDAHRAGRFRVVGAWSNDLGMPRPLGLHLAVEDTNGDSAIVEYVDGKLVIHHGAEYRVMTNDPHLDEMLTRMKKYKDFGGAEELPGSSAPEFRFARLASYYRYLPIPKDYRDAVAGALSLLRIAQVPFRDPARVNAPELGLMAGVQTNWVSAADVTNGIYYVNSATVPSLFWLDLKKAIFAPGSPLLFVDLYDMANAGDIAARLKSWTGPR